MSKSLGTIWDLEAHTARKHAILRRYFEAWLPILSTTNGRVVYIDGFAGPGVYSGGEDGSPVIVLKAARDHRYKPTTELCCIFVEADQKRHAHLESVLATLKPTVPMKNAEAEALLGQCLEVQRRELGLEHPGTLGSMNNLANVYKALGKYAQAEALDSQTLEIKRRVLGPEHPDTLYTMNNLANIYMAQGKYAQAEAIYTQTLAIQRRILGSEHRYTLISMSNLAELYIKQGKYAQGETLISQTLEIERRVLGSEHPYTLISMSNLAEVRASTYRPTHCSARL